MSCGETQKNYSLAICSTPVKIYVYSCIMYSGMNHRQDDDENLYNENRACNF